MQKQVEVRMMDEGEEEEDYFFTSSWNYIMSSAFCEAFELYFGFAVTVTKQK